MLRNGVNLCERVCRNLLTFTAPNTVFTLRGNLRRLNTCQIFSAVIQRLLSHQLTIKYARSSGAGGQNVNKVNTKVDVRFQVASASWIPDQIKEKLLKQEKTRINKDGELVVQSTKYRTQTKNMEDALEKLQALVDRASYVPKGPSLEKQQHVQNLIKKADERRLKEKKFQSDKKQERRNDVW